MWRSAQPASSSHSHSSVADSTDRKPAARPGSPAVGRVAPLRAAPPVPGCWWCGQYSGFIDRAGGGGVGIPNPARPRESTGSFCCWECASSYVYKYFPIQKRWLADLLVQDKAGYFVRRSTRAHARLQGPGIPSIDM